ncbi:hypothetical protein SAMN05443572_12042 [Myxococcus fulvus]|uniref:Uncharacterized protein n=1 Tax=Myxococcus fulvus TaxID=33 RepID=A0A511TJ58_MYXFU|nr:hypothetical protein [Myxococcus fulvus]GEN13372.1 hypothetical protein MFU01_84090 [Myxococcus fulvus]SEU42740.1 hypothetical protein SAMN05443572_12042 [Myxococcus fulvus]
MSVGPASGNRSGGISEQDAAARAAEEARRAAEAARKAAEAARKAAEAQAQQAAEAARKANSAFEGMSRQPNFDKQLGTEAPATSLLTEDTQDGQENCLDVAAEWADKATPELRAKSDMVFLKDTRAGAEGESGHVVIRQGEKVLDPTTNKSYESMEAFKKAQPHYQEAGSLSATHVKRILDTKPGSPERAAALDKAKVPAELQKLMVADGDNPSPAEQAKAAMEDLRWNGSQPEKYRQDFHTKFDGLKQKLEANPDPAYQKELLKLAQPWIQNNVTGEIGRINVTSSRMDEFRRMAQGLSPEAQQDLANTVAAGVKDFPSRKADLASGAYDFTLLRQLGDKGAPMAHQLALQMREVREKFGDAKKDVEQLNEKLSRLVAGFSGAMTPEQQTKAINAFRERHKDKYGALEEAAKNMTDAVKISGDVLNHSSQIPGTDPNLGGEARKVAQELTTFVNTDVGRKLIDEEVEKQTLGKPSMLDDLNKLAGSGEAVKIFGKDILSDMSKGLTNAVTRSLGSMALNAKMEGKNASNSPIIRRFDAVLEKNARLMGINPDQGTELADLKKSFKDLLEGKEGASATFVETLKKTELFAAGAGGDRGTAPALRGLAAIASAIGVAKDGTDLARQMMGDGSKDAVKLAADSVKLFGDTAATIGDTSTLVADMVNRVKPGLINVGGILKNAAPVGGLFGAAADAYSAIDAAKDGNGTKAAGKTMTALGGAVLSLAVLSNAVPGAGQIAAGALFLVGTGINIYADIKEKRLEEKETKAFLTDAGFPSALAEKIKDPELAAKTGQFLSQLSGRIDMDAQTLQAQLGAMDERQLDLLIRAVEHTQMDKAGFVNSDNDGGNYVISDGNSKPSDRNDPNAIKDKLGSMDDVISYLHTAKILVSEKDLVS